LPKASWRSVRRWWLSWHLVVGRADVREFNPGGKTLRQAPGDRRGAREPIAPRHAGSVRLPAMRADSSDPTDPGLLTTTVDILARLVGFDTTSSRSNQAFIDWVANR